VDAATSDGASVTPAPVRKRDLSRLLLFFMDGNLQ
jgi:hypothetical protein